MPTALELGPSGWKEYVEGARRRMRRLSVSDGDRREEARLLEALRGAAVTLKARFGASRVLLFGSLARGGWRTSASDVDLAVEGLTGDYWEAWGVVEDAIGDRRVDLVEIEAASPSLRAAIEAEGVEL
jgi:predicted nucleotidyltransferase